MFSMLSSIEGNLDELGSPPQENACHHPNGGILPCLVRQRRLCSWVYMLRLCICCPTRTAAAASSLPLMWTWLPQGCSLTSPLIPVVYLASGFVHYLYPCCLCRSVTVGCLGCHGVGWRGAAAGPWTSRGRQAPRREWRCSQNGQQATGQCH